MRWPFAPWTLLATIACTPEPRLTPIVGPDGTHMFHARCGSDEGRCFELAGERCPRGYDLSPTPGERGNYLIRCRPPASAGWAPRADLGPAPYGPPRPAPQPAPRPYTAPVPMTTVPPGYPPLGPAPPPSSDGDVGY